MSFFPCGTKAKKKYLKFGLIDMFRERVKDKSKSSTSDSSKPSKQQLIKPQQTANHEKLNKFVNELAEEKVSYEAVQKLAWNGIPDCLRPKIWKFLLRYALIHPTYEETLMKKRLEYQSLIKNYWKLTTELSEGDSRVYHTIEGDVKRIGAEFNEILKEPCLQEMLKRMLFVWHMRHPASGYVQGMCDITNPFIIVFLSEYLPLNTEEMKFQSPISLLKEDTLMAIEADSYWCISKMLEYVAKNYTKGFGGQHEAYSQVQELLYKIDQELFAHLFKQKIDLFALSFRCISTMMLRMFNPVVGIRLFDTYIAYEEEYPTLMIYLIIGILEKFAKDILKLKGDDLMGFVHKLPTKEWDEQDLEMVIAEAYVYKKIYTGKN